MARVTLNESPFRHFDGAAVISQGLEGIEATEPSAKRRPLSVVPDVQGARVNIKKLPLSPQSCRKWKRRFYRAGRLRAMFTLLGLDHLGA